MQISWMRFSETDSRDVPVITFKLINVLKFGRGCFALFWGVFCVIFFTEEKNGFDVCNFVPPYLEAVFFLKCGLMDFLLFVDIL